MKERKIIQQSSSSPENLGGVSKEVPSSPEQSRKRSSKLGPISSRRATTRRPANQPQRAQTRSTMSKNKIIFAVTARRPNRLPQNNLEGIRQEFYLPQKNMRIFLKRKAKRPTRDHLSAEELVRAAAN